MQAPFGRHDDQTLPGQAKPNLTACNQPACLTRSHKCFEDIDESQTRFNIALVFISTFGSTRACPVRRCGWPVQRQRLRRCSTSISYMRAHTRRLVQQLLLLLGILLLPICSTVLPPPTSQYTYLAADQEVPVDNLTDLTAVTSQEQLQQLQGLDTGLAAKFDFWILALSWPPSLVPVPAQSRARHAVIRHEAHAGFWTHGL